ncbi:hypothetical protein HERIO_1020 [Hepatospora eriocheir]|uniref:Uncharacterized protein n=1 Tax=Hepatospora eriocheir TaxID=1081669 RepID=A0A1X0QBG7_9MICR|nr:hypothetical protein HERIO_1020 [Hepatospora eriocheir]
MRYTYTITLTITDYHIINFIFLLILIIITYIIASSQQLDNLEENMKNGLESVLFFTKINYHFGILIYLIYSLTLYGLFLDSSNLFPVCYSNILLVIVDLFLYPNSDINPFWNFFCLPMFYIDVIKTIINSRKKNDTALANAVEIKHDSLKINNDIIIITCLLLSIIYSVFASLNQESTNFYKNLTDLVKKHEKNFSTNFLAVAIISLVLGVYSVYKN